jgi:hypothetical protein
LFKIFQAIKKVLVKYDHGDERLIWRDNKKPGKERIIVLGTKTNLKRLRGCELGAADITYEVSIAFYLYRCFLDVKTS